MNYTLHKYLSLRNIRDFDRCLRILDVRFVGWLVGCRVYGRLSHEGPRPMGGMPSVGDFSKGS